MTEPQLEDSPLSSSIDHEGESFDVRLYRLEGEPQWTLEVVGPDGVSHVFDERFTHAADGVALAEAEIVDGSIFVHDEVEVRLIGDLELMTSPEVQSRLRKPPAFLYGAIVASLTAQRSVPLMTLLEPWVDLSGSEDEVDEALAPVFDLFELVDEGGYSLRVLRSVDELTQWALGYLEFASTDTAWQNDPNCADDLNAIADVAVLSPDDETVDPDELSVRLEEAADSQFAFWAELVEDPGE